MDGFFLLGFFFVKHLKKQREKKEKALKNATQLIEGL